jgi:methyl-accepting chemotaxis protein
MIERLQQGSKNAVAVMEEGRRQTQAGVEQAARAGQTLQDITAAITSIRDLNTQIASAAEQQASVAEEINRSIVSINEVADETSLGMREAAMSSNQLTQYASQLQSLVERFEV